ncbi:MULTISPECIES: hypothetical protein [Methylorubrum]|uniref:hypothetical protein n=1 Tax=Methylorubrum TaxID=2282523 RepID=UPI00209CB18B|nr:MULTISPECIES: hypothetical protein [Methylorubrum]MCP1548435.1 hypothetical protein [Methylorubrum zatmanii]MCP1554950.1 hypothetical protein [Methylorubrum extorquens]MCP1578738.1 hypothetical protein [Methylorubrum extorquens]
MPEDVEARIAEVVMGLVRLSRLLPPDDMDSLLGAVAVEVETGMELVEERRLTRRADGNVVAFPGTWGP